MTTKLHNIQSILQSWLMNLKTSYYYNIKYNYTTYASYFEEAIVC